MPVQFDWLSALAESPIFLFLVACSVITLGVTIERSMHFWKRRDNADRILHEVLEHVRAGDLRRAVVPCDRTRHPFGAVAVRLLEGGDPMSRAADERIAVALSEQKLLLDRNLGVLATMAAIAPLLGLLGTVWGIMRAFGDMARVGSAAPSVVASGVAEALVTTAAGLVVAVPALVMFNHFARRANTMLTVSENHARTLRAQISEFRVGAPAPTSRSSAAAAASSAEPAYRS